MPDRTGSSQQPKGAGRCPNTAGQTKTNVQDTPSATGVFDLGSEHDQDRVRQLADAIVAGDIEPRSPGDPTAPLDACIAAHLATSKQTVRAIVVAALGRTDRLAGRRPSLGRRRPDDSAASIRIGPHATLLPPIIDDAEAPRVEVLDGLIDWLETRLR